MFSQSLLNFSQLAGCERRWEWPFSSCFRSTEASWMLLFTAGESWQACSTLNSECHKASSFIAPFLTLVVQTDSWGDNVITDLSVHILPCRLSFTFLSQTPFRRWCKRKIICPLRIESGWGPQKILSLYTSCFLWCCWYKINRFPAVNNIELQTLLKCVV